MSVCLRWFPPDIEARWAARLHEADSVSTSPRIPGADSKRAEELLEKFAVQRMPKTWARYCEARDAALKLKSNLDNLFPDGPASDPTGGEMFGKTREKCVAAVAEMFRRHDELAFFYLMRLANVFTDKQLKKTDENGGAAWLEVECLRWPDDTPATATAPADADAEFARSFLPATWAAYEKLRQLGDDGAVRYRTVRAAALALDAPRARADLMPLKSRLKDICDRLLSANREFGKKRLQRALDELAEDALHGVDAELAAELEASVEELGVVHYFAQKAKVGILTLPGGATMDMIWCPPGSFVAGSPEHESGRDENESPHVVTIAEGFWMAKNEMTWMQGLSILRGFQNVMMEKHADGKWYDCEIRNENDWRYNCQNAFEVVNRARVFADAKKGPSNLPCAGLDDKTDEFWTLCNLAGLFLPTENQWEYACRAGDSGAFAGTGVPAEMAWFSENAESMLHPVEQKMPNAWGFHDMHGNAHEKCAGKTGILRGGGVDDPAIWCRSAVRFDVERSVQEKINKMVRRIQEEGLNPNADPALLTHREMEKMKKTAIKLIEEGTFFDPERFMENLERTIGFRPVFKGK